MRLLRRDTAADVFFSQQPDMGIELLGEISVGISAEEAQKKSF